jgi:sugar/nucleoside kinase (ribokinase family)
MFTTFGALLENDVKQKNPRFDVFGVGNALVDVLARVSDPLIEELGLSKGTMTLMDAERQASVLSRLEHQSLQLASGGSAANTMVAIAQSGGSGLYFGRVAADTHGLFYKRDMEGAGIGFPVELAPESSLPTGTCVVLTTPDAERTMCTHLGVSTTLHKDQIDFGLLSDCQMCYVEGYLWDGDDTRAACIETFEWGKKLNVRTSFTFSDPFLVERFSDDFKTIITQLCDVVFCNADEARHFFDTDSLSECARRLGQMVELAFLTNSEHGCYVIEGNSVWKADGFSVNAIDSVGAGDAFAGGVLFGLTNGMSPRQAARWGNYIASRVVAQIGPRLERIDRSVLQSLLAEVTPNS